MPTPKYHITDLVASLEERRAVAFLGSGVSVGAGLPDWPKLLNELIALGVKEHRLVDAEERELTEWTKKTDYLMLADAVQRRLTRGKFLDFMSTRFGALGPKPTDVHRTLAALPFSAFITTNFDRLFEDAWSDVHRSSINVLTHKDRQALRDPFRSGTPFLMKTHGNVSNPESLVLGLKEFRESIHENRACQLLLQRIFLDYQVLFIGHSLTDPDLLFLLDQMVSVFGVPPREHVALIKSADVGRLRADTFLDNYGIRIETYDASPDHREVLEFVKELRQAYQARIAETGARLEQKLHDAPAQPREGALAALVDSMTAAVTAIAERKRGIEQTLALPDYCARHLGKDAARTLAAWYDSLQGTIELDLLRLNLDRECGRDDLEPHVWQEFLRRFAECSPTGDTSLSLMKAIIDQDPGLFMLKGRKIPGALALYRYMRHDHFLGMIQPRAADPAPRPPLIENELLGRPGRPVWCSDATFAAETNPHVIAAALWRDDVARIVEIAYTTDTLLPDNYLRVASVLDIYASRPGEANVKKPPAGTSDWCHTVRLDDPTLAERAPSAIHAPLRLLAARTQEMNLRVIG